MNARPVFPELVTGRDDDFPEVPWRVREGFALRGHASCDFTERILEVPLGAAPVDRVIRAHELTHLRISPHDVNPLAVYPDIPRRPLECAEEFRVNVVLARLGFAVELLGDGSEMVAGQRLGTEGAWAEAVCFFAALVGCGAEKDFLKGVRRSAPAWVKPLGVLKRRLQSLVASCSTSELASTSRRRDGSGLPEGFDRVSVPVAEILVRAMGAAVPETPEQLKVFKRALEPGGRRPPSGRFAELVWSEEAQKTTTSSTRHVRRWRAASSGRTLRYPSRLLTDPQRRAFVDGRRFLGGVVVVDQSGSMDVPEDELSALLSLVPAALVVGYSHRPGDTGGHPNAWILASQGRRAERIPGGNVGNGVDGPILEWAVRQRRSGEPIVWVTDGQVTDSNDHPGSELSRECARLVRRHRIRLVRTLAEATGALSGRNTGSLEPATSFGRVGRALQETLV